MKNHLPKAPLSGELSAKLTERLPQILIRPLRLGCAEPPPLKGEALSRSFPLHSFDICGMKEENHPRRIWYESSAGQWQPAQEWLHRYGTAGGRGGAAGGGDRRRDLLDRQRAGRRLHRLRRLREGGQVRLRRHGQRICREGEGGRRLRFRHAGTLRGGFRQHDRVPRPSVLLRAQGDLLPQARGRRHLRPPCGHHRGL